MEYKLHNQDAFAFLRGIKKESVNVIVTDPPYDSLEVHRSKGTTTRLKNSKSSSNKWFKTIPKTELPKLFSLLYRALANNSHCYVFCDQTALYHAKPAAEKAGFKFWKFLVWNKEKIGMGYHYRAQHELILFLEKGKRKLKNMGTPDVLSFPRIFRGYPTEKPHELAKVLIEQSSQPTDLVIDPFCGSGSTGVAALLSGRRFVGNDLEPEAIHLARQKLDCISPDPKSLDCSKLTQMSITV